MDPAAVSTLKAHCVYSLAVLLWLLIEQKYCRPDYAVTSNVNNVYDSIAEKKDSAFIEKRIPSRGEQSGGKQQALRLVVSMFNAQKQEELMLSWLDNFKLQVTTVLSSYETMETTV